MTKIAVGYVRCSTDMQEDSVEQQKQSITAWAKANGFQVVEWFEDEGLSGTSFDRRPAFMRMAQRISQPHSFEYVLVYDESRWGRAGNPRESTYWKVHFERMGVKVRIITSQSKNENDIGSYVVEVVESAEASEYSKKLSRSTMRGCLSRVRGGHSSGGSAPYGYKRIAVDPINGAFKRDLPEGVNRRKSEELVKFGLGERSEVETVKRMFEMRASGYGYKSIASDLNYRGVPCPKRGKWRNKDQKWSAGTVRSILQNPVYRGAKAYNRFPKGKMTGLPRGRRNPESEWVVSENAHTPIVSKELFEKSNVAKPFKYGGGAAKAIASPYLLSGLITCAHCGFNYVGYTRGAKNLRYYADSGYMNKGKSVCSWHRIPKDAIEGNVMDLIEENVLGSDVVQRVQRLIQSYLDSHSTHDASGTRHIESELGVNATKLQNLLALVEKGINLDTLVPRIKEIEAEKARLERESQQSKRLLSNRNAVKDAAQEAARFMLGFRDKMRRAPILEQKFLVRQIVQRITVDRAKDEISFALLRIPKTNNPILSAMMQDSKSGVHSRVCPEQDLNLHDLAAG